MLRLVFQGKAKVNLFTPSKNSIGGFFENRFQDELFCPLGGADERPKAPEDDPHRISACRKRGASSPWVISLEVARRPHPQEWGDPQAEGAQDRQEDV